MAESKGDNKGIKRDSLNLTNDSTIISNPSDLNRPLDVNQISSCNDQESTELDTLNNDSVSKQSEEMPKETTSLDIESSIQKTDETEQDPFIPDPNPTNQIVEDPATSKGNCNYQHLFKKHHKFLITAFVSLFNFHNFF